jgi:hypothetical protein
MFWYAGRLKNNFLLWNEKEFVYNIMQKNCGKIAAAVNDLGQQHRS